MAKMKAEQSEQRPRRSSVSAAAKGRAQGAGVKNSRFGQGAGRAGGVRSGIKVNSKATGKSAPRPARAPRFSPEEARRDLKASTQLSPLPVVMVSVGRPDGTANIVTIAWAGVVNSEPPMLSISVRKERYSYGFIEETGEFVVNLVGRSLLHACDFCGVNSGRDLNKWQSCHLHSEPVPELAAAPAIAESPLYLACKVQERLDLGSHVMFVAEIVAVRAKESLFDAQGKMLTEAAELVVYEHGQYHQLGEWLGFFGCSVAPPERFKARRGEHEKALAAVSEHLQRLEE